MLRIEEHIKRWLGWRRTGSQEAPKKGAGLAGCPANCIGLHGVSDGARTITVVLMVKIKLRQVVVSGTTSTTTPRGVYVACVVGGAQESCCEDTEQDH